MKEVANGMGPVYFSLGLTGKKFGKFSMHLKLKLQTFKNHEGF